jgi:ATPase subunit of ABC transporter with duplicated ATPase domains
MKVPDCSHFEKRTMLLVQNLAYAHPDQDVLFDTINLSISKHDKIALIGNNGTGKSTLLKIMSGALRPSSGTLTCDTMPYYIPQQFGQFNDYTVAQALKIEDKINALREILNGMVTEKNMDILADDWSVEERCREALSWWGLDNIEPNTKLDTLSGGQKTKVFLAGIQLHRPGLVLMDEPSNHLDSSGRGLLYRYIQNTADALLIVSHDRTLLNLLENVCVLSRQGITRYGGNYDFYKEQKALEDQALLDDLQEKEKALRKARQTERAAIEQQQKLDARGQKKQEKAGLPTISMNTLRNNAEKSTAKAKEVHAGKTGKLSRELNELRKELPAKDKMKLGLDDSTLHQGKLLVSAQGINYRYTTKVLWKGPLNFKLHSGDRIAVTGANGSGKTTLIKLVLGTLQVAEGSLDRKNTSSIYIDQDYSLVSNDRSVYDLARLFNTSGLEEHEIKSRLTHFLFTKKHWDKPCVTLSGGEKMRLMLCCLTLEKTSPDLIVLDEPTNNLDIQNIEILTNAINEYKGALLVVSHDAHFMQQINVTSRIEL